MKEEQYMLDRVDDQIGWYNRKSAINKTYHIWSNGLIIFFGTMIPFSTTSIDDAEIANRIAAGFGVLTAFFTGISALLKFHEKWANYRITSEALEREKILYRTSSGPYSSGRKSFQLFVQNIENLLSNENQSWAQLISSNSIETNEDTEITP